METRRTGQVTKILFIAIVVVAGIFSSAASAQQVKDPTNRAVNTQSQDASKEYVQPDFHERFHTFASDTFGPIRMSRAVFGAAISQATDVPPDWGQGWDAYGDRLASHFGVALVDGGANLALAQALREDTKYYPCTCKGILPRVMHALASSVTARVGPYGHRVFSIPAVASPYAGAFASLSWYPVRYGPNDALRTGNYNLLDDIGAKVALEFLSPLFKKLRHRN